MKNFPASSGEKKPNKVPRVKKIIPNLNQKKPKTGQSLNQNGSGAEISPEPVSWFNRIDYGVLIKKAGFLLWENRRRLIVLSLLLLLTGGQAITGGSSFSGGGNFSDPSQEKSEEDWKNILENIKSQDYFKNQIRNWAADQEALYAAIVISFIVLMVILAIALLFFFLNCHLHLLLIKNISYLSRGEKKSQAAVKREVKNRWKSLVYLRLVFGLMYLGVFLVFLLPAGLFALQKSWAMAVMLALLGLFSIIVAFIILGYVFRFSLFYFILANLGIRESIDKGYDLFVKNWKESILASVVNFALGIIAGLTIFF
ncbi:MAG: hypothetical protein FJZ04_03965, partial [Candidatus Moranbacteria bacterium]|nr:hypothetical protein [Candidatus Moranbacteria bacterium]